MKWFVSQPMGKNTVGNIVKSMCKELGIQGGKVNNITRKAAINNTCTCRDLSNASSAAFFASIDNYNIASHFAG